MYLSGHILFRLNFYGLVCESQLAMHNQLVRICVWPTLIIYRYIKLTGSLVMRLYLLLLRMQQTLTSATEML